MNANYMPKHIFAGKLLFKLALDRILEISLKRRSLMGKLKTANYWPFMKWDRIGLSALNLIIIRFK